MEQTDQIRCRYCRKTWPPEQFRTRHGKPTTHCSACLEAKRERSRLRRERMGPAGVRAANLWDKYRITVEQYDALRAAQQYRCGICGTHEDDITAIPTGRPRLDGTPTAPAVRLVVDHCHESHRVRGLLCNNCNTMIGLSSENPIILRAGAAYLEGMPVVAAQDPTEVADQGERTVEVDWPGPPGDGGIGGEGKVGPLPAMVRR